MEIEEEYKEVCGSIATCQENNRSFTLKNAIDFVKVKIDGVVFPKGDKTTRCDYLFLKEEEQQRIIEIFVELKGKDVEKAVKQLEQSIEMFAQSNKRYAFAVVTNVSTQFNTLIQKKTKEFKQKKHADLKVRSKAVLCDYHTDTNTLSISQ